MEIRVLKYFLAVAREENITRAAEFLHITQPTLSRQLMQLEEELNTQLFIRNKHRIVLTDEGMLLRKRAQEIVDLAEKTENEFLEQEDFISGVIFIGGGETSAMHELGQVMKDFKNEYPQVQYNLFSGNADDVIEKLDKGLIDIALLIEPVNIEKYDFVRLNTMERWGVLALRNSEIGQKESVSAQDLIDCDLIVPHRLTIQNYLSHWFKTDFNHLHIVATHNLINNASILAKEGLGIILTTEHEHHVYPGSQLNFVPLYPRLEAGNVLVWKKHQVFSKATTRFIDKLKKNFQ